MQTRPDHPTLLDAVAAFLLEDVSPKLEADKALQFRVLIAANLASVVANELRTHGARHDAELGRLAALLGHQGTLDELNRELAAKLRSNALDASKHAEALEHLWRTAKDTLEVTNPRFDLSEEPS